MTVRTIEIPTIGCAQRRGSSSLSFPPKSGMGARLAALARRGWHAYWQRRTRRATLLLLASLDERTLRDIGLSPSEITSVVYGAPDRIRGYTMGCPHRGGTLPRA
jgi:uncharacterized protein YjiS (DUF1127 family)